jgi:hypothetical protein
MISLKLLLEEVEQEIDTELEESKAAEEAKRQGLEYMHFGRYGKDGIVTHKSQGGKLMPVKGKGTAKTAGKAPAKPAARRASKPKSAASSEAKLEKIAFAVDDKVDAAIGKGKVEPAESYTRREFLKKTGLTPQQFDAAVSFQQKYSSYEHTFDYDKRNDEVFVTERDEFGDL